uniref:Uncharacterized protein n=1 Tax=Anopheles quadriannulatus TaxID=34691 RepID=A0A182XSY6_ANOQN
MWRANRFSYCSISCPPDCSCTLLVETFYKSALLKVAHLGKGKHSFTSDQQE